MSNSEWIFTDICGLRGPKNKKYICSYKLPINTQLNCPGPWVTAYWLTWGFFSKFQVRQRLDGDVDVRELTQDEFGRLRWGKAEKCLFSYWRAEGYIIRKIYEQV